LRIIKPNAPAPMSPAPGKANAAIVLHIIFILMSSPPVYFLPKLRKLMIALFASSWRYFRPEVAEKVNSGYIIRRHE
jgi:hypothetical protein